MVVRWHDLLMLYPTGTSFSLLSTFAEALSFFLCQGFARTQVIFLQDKLFPTVSSVYIIAWIACDFNNGSVKMDAWNETKGSGFLLRSHNGLQHTQPEASAFTYSYTLQRWQWWRRPVDFPMFPNGFYQSELTALSCFMLFVLLLKQQWDYIQIHFCIMLCISSIETSPNMKLLRNSNTRVLQ